MKSDKCFASLVAVLTLFMAGSLPATGSTITFSGDDWTSSNHGRVFIRDGINDEGWVTFDEGNNRNRGRQQWIWMDVASAVSSVPGGATVTSATLSYPSVVRNAGSEDVSDVIYSIFAVPGDGTDQGIGAVLAVGANNGPVESPQHDGDDVPIFYGQNTPYGAVTGITDTPAPQEFDVTDLVAGWVDGTLTENVGLMIQLWDRYLGSGSPEAGMREINFVEWVPNGVGSPGDAADRPTLTIEFTPIPEPSALVLVLLGSLGLGCGLRR